MNYYSTVPASQLQKLIEEYRRLDQGQDFTPQARGQRFNHFIAALLKCWGINATASKRSIGRGEIDVRLEFKGKHYILEAKWEKDRQNTTPIFELRGRLKERLEGTRGILLSMSGFTQEAEGRLDRGEQPTVLLMDRNHLKAMLSGFISPQEMLTWLVEKASYDGQGYVPLDELLSKTTLDASTLKIDFAEWDKPLVVKSELGFEAEVVAANLPTSQTKIAEYKRDQILFTQPDGVYLLDIAQKKVEPFLTVPDCKDIVVTHDQWVYIARSIGVARYKLKEGIQIVGGGFSNGSITNKVKVFLLGNGTNVWVVTDEYDRFIQMRDDWYIPPPPPAPTITKLGKQLGDEQRHSTVLLGGSVNNVALVGDNQFLALTERWGEHFLLATLDGHKQSMWYGLRNDYLHPKAALHLPNGKVLAALAGVPELRHLAPRGTFLKTPYTYGVELCVADISADVPMSIAQLNVFGEPIAFVQSVDGGGYLLANYAPNDQETVGVLIRWQWQQPW